MPTLCSLLLYLTCRVEVFNFERKEEEKEEEILWQRRSKTSPHVLTYTSPALTADTMLSIPLPVSYSLSQLLLSLSLCLRLTFSLSFLSPPSLAVSVSLSSISLHFAKSFSQYFHPLPPSTLPLSFHLSSSCGGVKWGNSSLCTSEGRTRCTQPWWHHNTVWVALIALL